MTRKTFGTEQATSADVNTYLMAQVVDVATAATRNPSPTEGMFAYDTDTDQAMVYNGTAWVCITPQSATVATAEATASLTYVALATAGPAVTVTTGTAAIVTLTGYASNNTGGQVCYYAVAVSGATTLAAADANASVITGAAAGYAQSLSRRFKLTGLTAGANTFTGRYRVSGGTGTFVNRDITVEGVPA